jgi:hypothetical protein
MSDEFRRPTIFELATLAASLRGAAASDKDAAQQALILWCACAEEIDATKGLAGVLGRLRGPSEAQSIADEIAKRRDKDKSFCDSLEQYGIDSQEKVSPLFTSANPESEMLQWLEKNAPSADRFGTFGKLKNAWFKAFPVGPLGSLYGERKLDPRTLSLPIMERFLERRKETRDENARKRMAKHRAKKSVKENLRVTGRNLRVTKAKK